MCKGESRIAGTVWKAQKMTWLSWMELLEDLFLTFMFESFINCQLCRLLHILESFEPFVSLMGGEGKSQQTAVNYDYIYQRVWGRLDRRSLESHHSVIYPWGKSSEFIRGPSTKWRYISIFTFWAITPKP